MLLWLREGKNRKSLNNKCKEVVILTSDDFVTSEKQEKTSMICLVWYVYYVR